MGIGRFRLSLLLAVTLLELLPWSGLAHAQRPIVTNATPTSIELLAGGGSTGGGLAIVTIRGTNLVQLTGGEVLSSGVPLRGVGVSLGPGLTSRFVTVTADVTAGASRGRLELLAPGVRVLTPVEVIVKAAALDASRAALGSFELSAESVAPGKPIQGTVTLTTDAPKGGAFVQLESTSRNLLVPASVEIPAGQRSAVFDIGNGIPREEERASLSATYGGVTRSAQVGVLSAPWGADLVIRDTPIVSAGESFVFEVIIENVGQEPAFFGYNATLVTGDPHASSIQVNRTQGWWINPFHILSGESRTFTLQPTSVGLAPGNTVWTFTVDPEDRIAESDETNNQFPTLVTIPYPQ